MAPIPTALLPTTSLDYLFTGAATIISTIQIALNGQILTHGAIQRLAGCPGGGTVKVTVLREKILLVSTHPTLILDITGNPSSNVVEIRRDLAGEFLYANYIWFAEAAPKGFGGVMLLLMAHEAHAHKLPRIDLLAAGGSSIKGTTWVPGFCGYVAWPMMGFEAALQPAILNLTKSVPHLAACTLVSEVVAIDKDWWQIHGDGWKMTFDLTLGSKSWDTLYQFCRSRRLI